MATRMGWFDVPLGADARTLVSTPEQAVQWINMNFGKPLKYYNTAATMRDIWNAMLTNGIVPEYRVAQQTVIIPETQLGSAFSAAPGIGLKVQINPGIGWIDGAYCILDEAVQLDVVSGQVNDIVLRLDLSNADVYFDVAVKTRSAATIEEALVRSGGVYELGLHTVDAASGATQVTAGMIADHRLSLHPGADGKPCCGIVGSLLQPDITAMYDRAKTAYQAILDDAVPPDGNMASGIFLADAEQSFASNNVEGALGELVGRFIGARYEIANKSVTIPVSAWAGGATEMRYEAMITDALIRADTDVEIILPDQLKGKTAMYALDPVAGAVTLCADKIPNTTVVVQISIWEVRANV